MNTALSPLEKLKAQRAKLEARIQAAESRAKASERKQDTRRKILLGAYYLEQIQRDGQMDEIKKHLDGFLVRDSDRQLFGLPPKANPANGGPA